MATATHNVAHWSHTTQEKTTANLWTKWLAFTAGQEEYKTLWFYVSLVAQGVLILPVPAVLMFYFNAPIVVLIITMVLFFANIIAGMGGYGTRVLISLFALSLVVHLIMLAIFII